MNTQTKWNIVNSILAGALVFLGGCSAGEITSKTIIFSLIAGSTAAVVQFQDYVKKLIGKQGEQPLVTLFSFVH